MHNSERQCEPCLPPVSLDRARLESKPPRPRMLFQSLDWPAIASAVERSRSHSTNTGLRHSDLSHFLRHFSVFSNDRDVTSRLLLTVADTVHETFVVV